MTRPILFPKGPPVLINKESAEVPYILLLLGECELALAELAVFEMNGDFLNAVQVTLDHQLQTNLVTDRIQIASRFKGCAVKREEAGHRILCRGQGTGQYCRYSAVQPAE